MRQNILITGVDGFIGSHLADYLIKKNYFVYGCDIKDRKNIKRISPQTINNKNFKYYKADVSDAKKFNKILKKLRINTVYHFAAIVGVQNYIKNPIEVIKFNILSTLNLCDFYKNKKTHIIFSSTSEVFGKNPRVPWSENADRITGPSNIARWSYSSSKNTCEHILFGYYKKYKLKITIVRFFNVYGPKQNPIYLVSKTIDNLLKNKKPLIYDNGNQTRCMTYVKDIIIALEKTMINKNKVIGKSYNLGNSKETTVGKVVKKICELSGKKNYFKKINTKKLYHKSYEDIIRRVPNTAAAKKDLNFKLNYSFKKGINETLSYYNLLKNKSNEKKKY